MVKNQKFFLWIIMCTLVIVLCSVYRYVHTNTNNLQRKSVGAPIPNIVHYVLFNKNNINFITYLSILSVIKVQKPTVIYIHSNKHNSSMGNYWHKLLQYASTTKTILQVSFLIQPTHVFGQRLSSVYHASDISRLYILRKYGGIYLDIDTLIINNMNGLRHYDCVIGRPKNQYIGNQLIMAKKTSTFLMEWQNGYKRYKPRDWYYNAGQYPTEVLEKFPGLCHIEPVLFGVHNLLDKLLSKEKWEWQIYYGIHILYRHSDLYKNIDELLIQNSTTNFGDIARWILTK